jgi:hypothetical protein
MRRQATRTRARPGERGGNPERSGTRLLAETAYELLASDSARRSARRLQQIFAAADGPATAARPSSISLPSKATHALRSQTR